MRDERRPVGKAIGGGVGKVVGGGVGDVVRHFGVGGQKFKIQEIYNMLYMNVTN